MQTDKQIEFYTHNQLKDKFFVTQTSLEILLLLTIALADMGWFFLVVYPFIKGLQMYFLMGKKVVLQNHVDFLEIQTYLIWNKKISLQESRIKISVFPRGQRWNGYLGIFGYENGIKRKIIYRLNWFEVFEIEDWLISIGITPVRQGFWY